MTARRDQLITVVEQLSWLCTKEISSSTHMNTVQELGTQHTTAWVFFVPSHYHGLLLHVCMHVHLNFFIHAANA